MNNKTFIITTMLIAVVVLGIGYAAISTTLTVNGNASGIVNNKNFKIGFTGTPTAAYYDGNDQPIIQTAEKKAEATIVTTETSAAGTYLKATFNVTNFESAGEYAVFTYEITNESEDIDAILSKPVIATISNPTYFGISAVIEGMGEEENATITLGTEENNKATLTVTASLDKNIVDSNQSCTFEITIAAAAAESAPVVND